MDYAMEYALMSDIFDEMMYDPANESDYEGDKPLDVGMNDKTGKYRMGGWTRFKNFWGSIWRAIKSAAKWIADKVTELWNKITKKKVEAPATAESGPDKKPTPARLALPGPTSGSGATAIPTSTRMGLPGPSAANAYATLHKIFKRFIRSANEVVQIGVNIKDKTVDGNLTPAQIDKLMSDSRSNAERAADANELVLEQLQQEASRTLNYGGPTVSFVEHLGWTDWLKELKKNAEDLAKCADEALKDANPGGDHAVSDDEYIRDLNAVSKQLQKVTTNIGKVLTLKVSAAIIQKSA